MEAGREGGEGGRQGGMPRLDTVFWGGREERSEGGREVFILK